MITKFPNSNMDLCNTKVQKYRKEKREGGRDLRQG